jgi:hypothetical protein
MDLVVGHSDGIGIDGFRQGVWVTKLDGFRVGAVATGCFVGSGRRRLAKSSGDELSTTARRRLAGIALYW